MSNVKVNGNTYNGVESIKLMKADNSGYAEYKENAADTDTLFDTLIAGGNIGDRVIEGASPVLNWMQNVEGGTISAPYATSACANINYSKFDNLLFPNVTTFNTYAGPATKKYMRGSNFEGTDVTGVLDLSSLATVTNNTVQFKYCTIGTLKLGSYTGTQSSLLSGATITNLVWNLPGSGVTTHLNSATKITNLYVPASLVSEMQTMVADGTLTKVTNVYSIDEWED